MDDKKRKLLERIEKSLKKEYEKYGEPTVRDVTDDKLFSHIENDLEQRGVAIVRYPITDEAWKTYFANIIEELSEYLFDTDDPISVEKYRKEYVKICERKSALQVKLWREINMLKAFARWFRPKYGFGNCSFRFLFHQYTKERFTLPVGENDIALARNPYHRHNIRLLATNRILWDVLRGFYAFAEGDDSLDRCKNDGPMVSWDSVKIRVNHPKATKPSLTKRHRDVYSSEGGSQPIQRLQAMLIKQEPGAISLGWSLYTHNAKIAGLISEYLGKPPDRFSSVEDEHLNPILDRYWRCAQEGFVIWKQHTVHYEGTPRDSNPVTSASSFTQERKAVNKISVRVCVGVHLPVGLSRDEKTQLAYLTEMGYQGDMYNNANRGTVVDTNTVDKKSTQYRIPRELSSREIEHMETVEKNYRRGNCIVVNRIPRILRQMYGLYQ